MSDMKRNRSGGGTPPGQESVRPEELAPEAVPFEQYSHGASVSKGKQFDVICLPFETPALDE